MKQFSKWMIRVLVAVCTLCLSFAIVACGDKGDDSSGGTSITVTLGAESLEIEAGIPNSLSVTVEPAGETVTWTTSNQAVVSVDNNGMIFGHKPGTATITATVGDQSDACEVTVVNTTQRQVVLVEDEINLTMADTYTIEGMTLVESSKVIEEELDWTFSLDDPPGQNIQVNSAGIVTPKETGTFRLLVSTTYLGKTYSASLKVVVIDDVQFTMSTTSVELVVPENIENTMNAYALDTVFIKGDEEQNVDVEWSTSDANVATVVDGMVTATGLGAARITATVEVSGEIYTCFADVNVVRAKIVTERFMVDVNEIDTWTLDLAEADEEIIEYVTLEGIIVSELKDGVLVLIDSIFPEAVEDTTEVKLYLNDAYKSYEVTVEYYESYRAVNAASFVNPAVEEKYKDNVTLQKWKSSTEKIEGRYDVFTYQTIKNEKVATNNVWFNRMLATQNMKETYAQYSYLAFDVYFPDVSNVYGLWFYTADAIKTGTVDNGDGTTTDTYQAFQHNIQPYHWGLPTRTYVGYDPISVKGDTGVLVQDQNGLNVTLIPGEWLTVLINLDTINLDTDGNKVDPHTLGFSIREKVNIGVTAYFSKFRLYTQDNYEAYQNSFTVDNTESYKLDHKVFWYPQGKTSTTTSTFERTMDDIGGIDPFKYSTAESSDPTNRLWTNRIGTSDLTDYFTQGRYFAFDIYIDDSTATISGIMFGFKFGINTWMAFNDVGKGAYDGTNTGAVWPTVGADGEARVVDANGEDILLKKGEWVTIIIDMTKIIPSVAEDRTPDMFYISLWESNTTQGNTMYLDNFRLYNETQYAAYNQKLAALKEAA